MRGKIKECVNIPLGAYPSGRSIHARTGRVLQRSAGRSGNFKLPSSTFHPELKFERHRGGKRGWGQMWGFQIKRRVSDKKSKRYNWRSGIHLRRRTPKNIMMTNKMAIEKVMMIRKVRWQIHHIYKRSRFLKRWHQPGITYGSCCLQYFPFLCTHAGLISNRVLSKDIIAVYFLRISMLLLGQIKWNWLIWGLSWFSTIWKSFWQMNNYEIRAARKNCSMK